VAKRTVKAWGVLIECKLYGPIPQLTRNGAREEARDWRMNGKDSARAIPVTVVYDDGKKARKK